MANLKNLVNPKSILARLTKAVEAFKSETEDNKVLLDPSFGTVKEKVKKSKPATKKKKPEPTDVVPWDGRRKTDTLFAARPSVLVGFPMSKPKEKPKGMHLLYQRANGAFSIDIVSDPRFGVPYGQDQLFILAIVDHALKNNSPKVDIGSIYKILKELGMCTGGSQYRAVQQTILRVFGSTVTCWYKDGKGVSGKKFSYFDEVHLEVLKDKYDYNPENGDYIIFSDKFYSDLKDHPIPYDMEMLKRLKGSPGATRFYLWAAPRAYRIATGAILVSWEDLAIELGADASNNLRAFKQNLKSWIVRVSKELEKTNGQKLKADIKPNGVLLYKQEMVPGAHRQTIKIDISKKTKSIHKGIDTDWVLEKEIEAFESGRIASISQKAIEYKRLKNSLEKSR